MARRWSAASPGSTASRSASSPITACCFPNPRVKGAHFIELCDQRHIADPVPAEHHRLHGRHRRRARRHRQTFGQAGLCGVERARAAIHRDHRRLLWRRQLRHVRTRFPPALSVRVAERPHRHDERRRRRDRGHRSAPLRASRASAATKPRSRSSTADAARSSRSRATPITRPRGCGTTASSSPARRATCLGFASRWPRARSTCPEPDPSTGCECACSSGSLSDRQPRRDRRPHHAHLPRGSASAPSRSIPTPIATRCTSPSPTRRSASGPPPPRDSYLGAERHHAGGRPHAAPRRSIPATASCRRSRIWRALCADGGADLRRAVGRSHRGDGVEDRARSGSRVAPACRACPAITATTRRSSVLSARRDASAFP